MQESLPLTINPEEVNQPLQIKPLDYYNRTFIELNDAQNQAVQSTLPLVVGGAAGSGKTCVALSLHSQLASQLFWDEDGEIEPLIYVSQSPRLVQSMSELWKSLPVSQTATGQRVEFETYESLYKKLMPELNQRQSVDELDVLKWLDGLVKTYRILSKAKRITIEVDENFLNQPPYKIYQEMRIACACKSLEDYLKLGRRESSLDQNQRLWIWDALTRYVSDCDKANKIHWPLHPVKSAPCKHVVVVDEAQDLSDIQLAQLKLLACENRYVFCIDSNQMLNDEISKRPFLLKRTDNDPTTVQYIELPIAYRCPANIIDLANTLLKIKHKLTGGLSDKYEYSHVIPSEDNLANPGNISWNSPEDREAIDALREKAQTPKLAVIAPAEFHNEAQKLFNTPLIFTPEEIKGLEFPEIIAFKLFDHDIFNDAGKRLNQDASVSGDYARHRAKEGQADTSFINPFNHVFTSFTRASEALYIIQDSRTSRHLHHLLEPLRQHITTNLPENNAINQSNFSEKDWKELADNLIAANKLEQARNLLKVKLHYTNQMIEDLINPSTPAPFVTKQPVLPETEKITPPPIEKRVKKPKAKNEMAIKNSSSMTKPNKAQKPISPNAQLVKNAIDNSIELPQLWKNFKEIITLKYSHDLLFGKIYNDKSLIEYLLENKGILNKLNLTKAEDISNFPQSIAKILKTADLGRFYKINGKEKPLLFALLEHPFTISILKEFFKNNPRETISKIPKIIWADMYSLADSNRKVPLLFILSQSPELFFYILNNLPSKEFTKIPLQFWYDKYFNEKTKAKTNVLYEISKVLNSSNGSKDLVELYNAHNQHLIKKIPLKVWFENIPNIENHPLTLINEYQRINLTEKNSGFYIIHELALQHGEEFFKFEDISFWFHRMYGTNSISKLAGMYYGQHILCCLLEHYYEKFEKLFLDDINYNLNSNIGNTLLFLLTTTTDREGSFLMYICQEWPELIKKIPLENWFKINVYTQFSPISNLLYKMGENGLMVLDALLIHKPELTKYDLHFWSTLSPPIDSTENTNKLQSILPLHTLVQTTLGIQILHRLLDREVNILNIFNNESLDELVKPLNKNSISLLTAREYLNSSDLGKMLIRKINTYNNHMTIMNSPDNLVISSKLNNANQQKVSHMSIFNNEHSVSEEIEEHVNFIEPSLLE